MYRVVISSDENIEHILIELTLKPSGRRAGGGGALGTFTQIMMRLGAGEIVAPH